ncbi:MAG: cell division protein FtsZ [Candidatus Staskawiczbacteria bacterium RIFCSPLOWO2_01_FULL_40_39]|uniref:Cell division protein FtsZ n=1 Tax=Candidatus Staskawiczbacteria bacterium RIFCSPHIGHO2_01_FULL_39_25 TaxID=1802202 RepID=A0A1G2HNR3_9BACT|nr:MAG: cell division protein FtsZ [Candidatus Staskawiczbacteria bacterium RIFCSPHIGHO2_01_FULL_39_25]OGZ73990.1 MAG: cell division protein FtsZ [Candidatus Staskawiczbacteria bacterium RIFCSPLOWO2_01_FULL_40_39]OGZ76549.1 MAG: cell division protein FtsZ [Candidatus Staskawiczbacteria bacterium RIFCSPLOWO2_02_FULL_39_8]
MNPKIKVVGVGGSGSNTISRIAKFNVRGVDLIAVNTDAQALHFCKVPQKILIGKNITKGLGAGMDVSLGRQAAQESQEEITEALRGADMVFITCGLGGGTGSGAGPIIAELSQKMGILTIAVVTTPFSFEGEQRKQVAKKAMEDLTGKVDSLLIISNDKLLKIIDEKTTVSNAFEICDDTLKQAVQGITDLILAPGIITIDFASVISIMKNSGQALFGTGKAQGANRAVEAATKAINSPLLDFSIKGSKGILFNASGNDTTLNEIQEAAKVITENADPRAQIIFGAVKDDMLKKGELKITVIATKF